MSRTSVTPEMRQKARSLRQRMTRGEQALWNELRDLKQNGLKFRRQSPIGPYIVDFVCLSRPIVVKVDGDFHETIGSRNHDAVRDAYLRKQGYVVLRYDAPVVRANAWHVAREISAIALQGTDRTKTPAESTGKSTSGPTRLAARAAVHPPRKGEGEPPAHAPHAAENTAALKPPEAQP